MNELYHSGSILIFSFSGVSGSAFLSNNYDNCMTIDFRNDKGFVRLKRFITKSDLINNYMLLRTDGYYLSKYKLTV